MYNDHNYTILLGVGMNYRYEKLLDDLNTIEENILFKESQFLKDCWCYDSTDCELIDVYFSSEYCILIVVLPCGTQVKVTVKMDVVLEWMSVNYN